MKTRFASCWLLACSALLTAALSTREALATRACAADTDCPKGFDCESSGTTSEGGPAGTCMSLPCQSNSDCGPGLSCFLDMTTLEPFGPSSACVPQWYALGCSENTACGPGFTCSIDASRQWDCPGDRDASQPPWAVTMIVPCSDALQPVVPPVDSGFPAVPTTICLDGGTCLYTTWNECFAQQTGPCTVDSDCPSTWSCGCQTATCGVLEPADLVDAGCTMACIPPNSDLLVPGACLGGVASGTTPMPAVSDGGIDSGAAGPADSEVAVPGGSSRGGGCQMATGDTTTGWTLVAAGVLALGFRRPARRRRGFSGARR
jgi:hypothetical protein